MCCPPNTLSVGEAGMLGGVHDGATHASSRSLGTIEVPNQRFAVMNRRMRMDGEAWGDISQLTSGRCHHHGHLHEQYSGRRYCVEWNGWTPRLRRARASSCLTKGRRGWAMARHDEAWLREHEMRLCSRDRCVRATERPSGASKGGYQDSESSVARSERGDGAPRVYGVDSSWIRLLGRQTPICRGNTALSDIHPATDQDLGLLRRPGRDMAAGTCELANRRAGWEFMFG
jgi:hypothetical protein